MIIKPVEVLSKSQQYILYNIYIYIYKPVRIEWKA